MKNIWFISDTHFGHANFLNFVNEKGEKIRPFNSVEEMDEYMILEWNKVVMPGDKVYHLGDFAFGKPEKYAPRLNGKKRLILGNHDDLIKQKLGTYFEKILVWRLFKEFNFLCTHVPIHRESFRKVDFNVHGHIHDNPSYGPEYVNICVEKTNYRPLHLDEVRHKLMEN